MSYVADSGSHGVAECHAGYELLTGESRSRLANQVGLVGRVLCGVRHM